MVQKNVVEKMELGVMTGRHSVMLENIIHLLSYMSDIDGAKEQRGLVHHRRG